MTLLEQLVFVGLLLNLDNPSYKQRVGTEVVLQRFCDYEILDSVVDKLPIEGRSRGIRLLKYYYLNSASSKVEKLGKLPWIDMSLDVYGNRDKMTYLKDANSKPPEWITYRQATKVYIRDLYSERSTANQVEEVLRVMWVNEFSWIRKYGKQHNIPLPIEN